METLTLTVLSPWIPMVTPHISYCDNTNHCLKYAVWSGPDWNAITIDYAGYALKYINPRPIGATSLALDENDRACTSYFDESNYRLKYFAANTSFSTPVPLPSPSPSPSSTSSSSSSSSSTSTGSSNYQASSAPQQSPSTSPSPAPESAPQPDSTSQSAGTHALTFPIVTATAGATTGIFSSDSAFPQEKTQITLRSPLHYNLQPQNCFI